MKGNLVTGLVTVVVTVAVAMAVIFRLPDNIRKVITADRV
jgi:hypothetical protein